MPIGKGIINWRNDAKNQINSYWEEAAGSHSSYLNKILSLNILAFLYNNFKLSMIFLSSSI
jgi:hypothetical protein